jgi:DNA-binding NtrC family response regulator
MTSHDAPARVLLVEDDADVRRLARLGLQMGGFSVDEAATGRAALLCVDDTARDYAAIVVDLGLPDVGGEDVVARAQFARPRVGIVVCTGARTATYAPPVVFLEKPYTPMQLSQTVRRAIGLARA